MDPLIAKLIKITAPKNWAWPKPPPKLPDDFSCAPCAIRTMAFVTATPVAHVWELACSYWSPDGMTYNSIRIVLNKLGYNFLVFNGLWEEKSAVDFAQIDHHAKLHFGVARSILIKDPDKRFIVGTKNHVLGIWRGKVMDTAHIKDNSIVSDIHLVTKQS